MKIDLPAFSQAIDRDCTVCEWFEKCEEKNSQWKIIHRALDDLRSKIIAYIIAARTHLITTAVEKTYKMGEVFNQEGCRDKYLLAQTDSRSIALIALDGGNRWNTPVFVKDTDRITEAEFELITNGKPFIKSIKEGGECDEDGRRTSTITEEVETQ